MKRLVAALLLGLTLLFPSLGSANRTDEYFELSHWAGCHAAVVTSDQHSIVESYYQPMTRTIYLGTKDDGVPPELAEMVALHEISHCLQDQDGTLEAYAYETVRIELDADRRAADLACAMGKDGAGLLHDLFVWAHERYGYEGDYLHGSLADRISQSDGAPACHPAPVQGA